jgi:hypothetical protein
MKNRSHKIQISSHRETLETKAGNNLETRQKMEGLGDHRRKTHFQRLSFILMVMREQIRDALVH